MNNFSRQPVATVKGVAWRYQIARHYARFDGTKALLHYQRALALADSLLQVAPYEGLGVLKGRIHASLGVTYYLEGKYPKAIAAELAAIDIFEKEGVKESLGRCFVVIGAIYAHQDQPDEARKYHQKAYAINHEVGDSTGMALALNNMGISYFDQDSLAQAQDHYQQALQLYQALGDDRGMSVELLNMDSVAQRQKNLVEAATFFRRSLRLREKIQDQQGLIFSNSRLGEALLARDSAQSALVHAKRSFALANENGMVRGLRDANELLARVYAKLGQYQVALEHFSAYVDLKDSMSDAESIKRVSDAENRFKFRQQQLADSIKSVEAQKALETEIALKDAKAKQQRLTQFLLVGGIVVTILLVLLSYGRYQKSKKQNALIEAQKQQVERALVTITNRDEEKELLLKEIHHRVKNNLQVVSSLLELQAKKGDESAQTAFADGQSRVKAMALIHERLYRNEDIASIDFADYAGQLAQQISALFPLKNPEINVEGNGCQFDIDTAVPLGLIINELITNAFKYAFAENEGKLTITITEHGEEGYQLVVQDNGAGMPQDFSLKTAKSLGLRLVTRLSRQLYGKAEYENRDGAVFNITFKDTLQRKKVA